MIPFKPELTVKKETRRAFPQGNLSAAVTARQKRRAEWATLDLRQQWADETFMRQHLASAGPRVADSSEPATVTRLKALLRRVGILTPDVLEYVGTDLPGFLKLNPKLPLWAALALILEASGKYTKAGPA